MLTAWYQMSCNHGSGQLAVCVDLQLQTEPGTSMFCKILQLKMTHSLLIMTAGGKPPVHDISAVLLLQLHLSDDSQMLFLLMLQCKSQFLHLKDTCKRIAMHALTCA